MSAPSEGSKDVYKIAVEAVSGDIVFQDQWTVFAPLKRSEPKLSRETLSTIPKSLKVAGKTLEARKVTPTRNQFDFQPFFGARHDPSAFEKTAYVFVPLKAKSDMEVTLGLGCDNWIQAWVNGDPILGGKEMEDQQVPVSINDFKVKVQLKKGANVLAVRFIAGKGSAVLALGGPRELRAGDFRSILDDPFVQDPRWSSSRLTAKPGEKKAADIGSRLELFVDDFLIDGMTGSAERRLHHPVPREVVLKFGQSGKPWDGNCCAYHSIIRDGDRIRMYYRGAPAEVVDEDEDSVTCVVESPDGICFTYPEIGLYEFNGSKANNIIWKGRPSHNFTPFLDTNQDAPADQRFKAIAYHPENGDHSESGGLGAFASPDGIHWRLLVDKPIITVKKAGYGFDSQNLAFWDPLRKLYVCFFRNNNGGLRRIATCTSNNFVDWSKSTPVQYADDRLEHMYINTISPYFRAPHIYIGMPARFVPFRKNVSVHPHCGISDAILMSSRDGLFFERWEEGFIRPAAEPEVWTDRNNYPAWGMIQTSPEEISLYWSEHNRHPGNCLRRGTIRTDGFVSVHAGGDVGEMLTRPLIFSGTSLVVNYATSAIGSLRFAVCDPAGKALAGFTMADCEVLYGNEIEHAIRWHGGRLLNDLVGKPVRLRVRLHDSDLYSIRFASGLE